MNNSIYRSQEGKAAILETYDSLLAAWPVPYKKMK